MNYHYLELDKILNILIFIILRFVVISSASTIAFLFSCEKLSTKKRKIILNSFANYKVSCDIMVAFNFVHKISLDV